MRYLILILLGIFFFLTIMSCGVTNWLASKERTLSESVVVTKNLEGDYIFNFYEPDDWKVFMGPSPSEINYDFVAAQSKGRTMRVARISPNDRLYFAVTAPDRDTFIVSERRIPMEGSKNFRDIGGLPTKDGRYVSWGKIYRADKLSDLSSRDLDYFANLGIHTIIDFRNDVEVNKHPDRYPSSYPIEYLRHPIGDKEGETYAAFEHKVRKKKIVGKQVKELFAELMTQFADSVAGDFKPLFDRLLLDDSTPLVYHCSGGKDRTGYASAMILLALGVDEETVRKEYLMSNYYRYDKNKKNMRIARLLFYDLSTLEYLMVVQQEYIDAVFNVIKDYGGVDQYLEDKFDLTFEKRELLREKYTFGCMCGEPTEGLEAKAK